MSKRLKKYYIRKQSRTITYSVHEQYNISVVQVLMIPNQKASLFFFFVPAPPPLYCQFSSLGTHSFSPIAQYTYNYGRQLHLSAIVALLFPFGSFSQLKLWLLLLLPADGLFLAWKFQLSSLNGKAGTPLEKRNKDLFLSFFLLFPFLAHSLTLLVYSQYSLSFQEEEEEEKEEAIY